jgi:hypothetical protein
MATMGGKESLLKEENKEIKIELDPVQLCWMIERRGAFLSDEKVGSGEGDLEGRLVVQLIKECQHGQPCRHSPLRRRQVY